MLLQLLRGSPAIHQTNILATASSVTLQSRSATSRVTIPEAPKKPRFSPYLGFVVRERENLKKAQPDLQARDLIKTLAAQWRTMDAEAKERYKQLSLETLESRLEAYRKEHQAFLDSLTPEQLQKLNEKASRRAILRIRRRAQTIEESLGKPKKVPNPFCLFMRDLSEAELAVKIRLPDALRQWESLPEEKKESYRHLYQKKLAEYAIPKEEYKQRKLEDEAAAEKLKALKRRAASVKAKLQSKDGE